MSELKIDSPFDFSIYIERVLRESKSVRGVRSAKAMEEFAKAIFAMGFEAGKKPENHPIYNKMTGN